ncbi:hypothetical protein [Paenibacillus oceani]|uniref:Uncharacterized protein n=1 Tax=Paenibacillus oceani TaxID=2772510 RepID=A0A927GY90_9BACL|nr:hypothetical protein [Paenibacillus oceani]MBD2860792.1 hypothetical protein [Paenibacillus oceani]
MPYVLKHAGSSELFACRLVNRYELDYFGVKDWADESAAREEKDAFLAGRGVPDAPDWVIAELEEMKLKMCNVKLRNDPSNRVYVGGDGTIRVEKR